MPKYQMQVEAQPQYLADQSDPGQGVYGFAGAGDGDKRGGHQMRSTLERDRPTRSARAF